MASSTVEGNVTKEDFEKFKNEILDIIKPEENKLLDESVKQNKIKNGERVQIHLPKLLLNSVILLQAQSTPSTPSSSSFLFSSNTYQYLNNYFLFF